MVEAMACGTPVVAFPNGAVPEVVDHGVTGWVVGDECQAVAALRDIERFDRAACRQRFEERFSARRMARDYVDVYQEQLAMPANQESFRPAA
jgi:glycosyltransferase involved in cell wall biosynthesis